MQTISRFFECLIRSIKFAIIGWGNYDWDHGYLTVLMEFKLKRMQKCMMSHTFIDWNNPHNKKGMQSLRISAKLLDRINNKHYHYFLDEDERINGKMPSVFSKDREVSAERSELFMEAFRKDDAQEDRDRRLLFDIMKKYHQHWWD